MRVPGKLPSRKRPVMGRAGPARQGFNSPHLHRAGEWLPAADLLTLRLVPVQRRLLIRKPGEATGCRRRRWRWPAYGPGAGNASRGAPPPHRCPLTRSRSGVVEVAGVRSWWGRRRAHRVRALTVHQAVIPRWHPTPMPFKLRRQSAPVKWARFSVRSGGRALGASGRGPVSSDRPAWPPGSLTPDVPNLGAVV